MRLSNLKKAKKLKTEIRRADSVRNMIEQRLIVVLEKSVLPEDDFVDMYNYYTQKINNLQIEINNLK